MRDLAIRVRVTAAEREAWQAKAQSSGMSLSDLVRQAMERVRAWTPPNREVERQRAFQLARIGTNLNQIARWANTYKEGAEALQVIAHLRAIEQALSSFATRSSRDASNGS